MATLKRIVRSNPISNFKQVTPAAGSFFDLAAEAMNIAYERIEPAAIEEMERRGGEYGREMARQHVGENRYSVSTRNGDDIDDFNASLARTESGGNYEITNSEGYAGKYQFGQARLDDYNRANGTSYKTSDLTASTPEARKLTEDVQRWHVGDIDADLGKYVGREVNGQVLSPNAIRAMAHLGGKAGARRYIESGGKYDPADSNGTKLSDYAKTHGGVVTRVSTRNEPGVTIRTKDGKLEGRRYSPYAGPILQAHDAAAKVAYQSAVLNKSAVDLLDISQQYTSDPDGFSQAAEGYVQNIVDAAPEEMRGELHDTLSKEVTRRRMGLMAEKQSDIRNRANNESKALVERWSQTYAEALASGDPYETAEAQERLDSILRAREALPGVAWTDEQSANVFLKAEGMADRIVSDQVKARSAEIKDTLNLIIKAAKEGQTAEGEGILADPQAWQEHPELAREAAAYARIRDNEPEFMKQTPAQQAAQVAEMLAQPVGEEWELDVREAAAKMAKENRKAWADDPVQRAAEVFPESPPPSLPDLSSENPDQFVAALQARREYMNKKIEQGYTDTQAYLSQEEAESIGTLMGAMNDPAARMLMAGAIVQGFGPDAVRVFDEIGGDPATSFMGKAMASGVRQQVAMQIAQGQAMISEGVVRLPNNAFITSFSNEVGSAFEEMGPYGITAQREALEAAKAIYATKSQGIEPTSDEADTLMTESIQTALGQATNKKGQTVGGVQTVMGHPTIMPPEVSGEDAEAAVMRALGGDGGDFIARSIASAFGGVDAETNYVAAWEAAGTGVPQWGGEPIPMEKLDQIHLVSTSDGRYRMMLGEGALAQPIADENGMVVMFDLPTLMEALE